MYLSALRQLHIANNHPDPKIGDMAKLEQVLRGIKREQGKAGKQSNKRLPITPSILKKFKGVWEKDAGNPDHIMLWAAVCLCFFGFLRIGEITVSSEAAYDEGAHLTFEIDNISSPTLMKVHIKASKTDPCRKGVDLFLGRSLNDLCPITAMLTYLAIRGNKKGFLFQFTDSRLLTNQQSVSAVREALT